jgi:hypothetical protein
MGESISTLKALYPEFSRKGIATDTITAVGSGEDQSVTRKEDDCYLQGKDIASADLQLAGMPGTAVVRSPLAYARTIAIAKPNGWRSASSLGANSPVINYIVTTTY